MEYLSIDFNAIHHVIVELVLLILLLIGAYKLIRNEWPKKDDSSKRVRQKTEVKDE